MVSVDGVQTKMSIISAKRSADFLDKYAERTEDGVLHREPIGVYYNYQIKFGWSYKMEDEYDRFSYQLSEPKEFHSIVLPYGLSGNRAFEGYCASISDELLFSSGEDQYWRGLTASFISRAPSRAFGTGSEYSITIGTDKSITCKRKFDALDKYAERTEDGGLHRELIGVYHNYQLKLGWSYGGDEWYHNFYEAITSPIEFHTVTVPDRRSGTITQRAYFGSVTDELFLERDGKYYWRNLTANMIPRSPTRVGSSLAS